MNAQLYQIMEAWLVSGDPLQQRHARYRLSLPDAEAFQRGEPEPELEPVPVDLWTARIRACPDYNPGCCSSPAPYCSRFAINPTREKCIECLSE